MELQRQQHPPQFSIGKAEFSTAVYEVMQETFGRTVPIEHKAMEALHEAAETIVVKFFQDAQLAANHAGRNIVRM